ncbi:hypothetical protein BDW62DRAFT_206041 [Aspergillus aurantiobrunneus]
MDHYIPLTLRVPLALRIASPWLFDELSLLLASILSTGKYQPQRAEIDAARSSGFMQDVDPQRLQQVVEIVAGQFADEIAEEFLPRVRALLEAEKEEEPAVPSADETKEDLGAFVEANFQGSKSLPKEQVQRIVAQVADRAQLIAQKYKVPPQTVTKAARLSFYDYIVFYDDSKSMRNDSRIPTLKATVRGLFSAARLLNADAKFSVIPFADKAEWENVRTEGELEEIISQMKFHTSARVAEPLAKRVLQPIAAKVSDGESLHPTVVVVVTDGGIGVTVSKFGKMVSQFKSYLVEQGYDGPTVLFLVCRVGNDDEAAESLRQINETPSIQEVIYYSNDSLDLKLETLQDPDAYVGEVIADLVRAMELQAKK